MPGQFWLTGHEQPNFIAQAHISERVNAYQANLVSQFTRRDRDDRDA